MTGRLSPADIDRIRELAPTHCYSEIAKHYGVSKDVIKELVRVGKLKAEKKLVVEDRV